MRGWPIVVSVAVAACGRIGFDDPATCDLAKPGISSLVDDFSDGVLAPSWFGRDTCVTETGGALVAPLTPNVPKSYCLVYTTSSYRVGCDGFFLHVAEVTAPVHGSQTVLYLGNAEHTFFLLLDSGGFQLSADNDLAGTVFVDAPYDPVADAWWRIRADAAVLHFDTSPNGTTWNDRAELGVDFPLDDLEVTLGAGAYLPLAAPGQARFRCFNEPPPCN